MDSVQKSLLFAITVITCCIVATTGTECVVNPCPDNERCFQRNVPNQPSYVCECTKPYFHGYNCMRTNNNKVIETCYGDTCATGTYASPNYPSGTYGNEERILVLIYIPRATEIRFSFAPTFSIEGNADELFVGSGLQVPHNTLGQENDLQPRQYFFEGFSTPDPFSVYNDTAFIFFNSDDLGTSAGFQISWNATVADPPRPPTTTPPPPTTRQSTTTQDRRTTKDTSSNAGVGTTENLLTTPDLELTDSAAHGTVFQTRCTTTILVGLVGAIVVKGLDLTE